MEERVTVVEVNSPALQECKGIVRGEKYGSCYIVEFVEVPNNYFQLPCTQAIDKRYCRILGEEE